MVIQKVRLKLRLREGETACHSDIKEKANLKSSKLGAGLSCVEGKKEEMSSATMGRAGSCRTLQPLHGLGWRGKPGRVFYRGSVRADLCPKIISLATVSSAEHRGKERLWETS